MPSCGNCGTTFGDSANFCPNCATPQNDEARKRFEDFIDKRASKKVGGSGGTRRALLRRVRYTIGYVAIVAGLSTLLEGAGLFFLLAGLSVLPPMQQLVENQLGRSIGIRPPVAVATVLSVVGTATFFVV